MGLSTSPLTFKPSQQIPTRLLFTEQVNVPLMFKYNHESSPLTYKYLNSLCNATRLKKELNIIPIMVFWDWTGRFHVMFRCRLGWSSAEGWCFLHNERLYKAAG